MLDSIVSTKLSRFQHSLNQLSIVIFKSLLIGMHKIHGKLVYIFTKLFSRGVYKTTLTLNSTVHSLELSPSAIIRHLLIIERITISDKDLRKRRRPMRLSFQKEEKKEFRPRSFRIPAERPITSRAIVIIDWTTNSDILCWSRRKPG